MTYGKSVVQIAAGTTELCFQIEGQFGVTWRPGTADLSCKGMRIAVAKAEGSAACNALAVPGSGVGSHRVQRRSDILSLTRRESS